MRKARWLAVVAALVLVAAACGNSGAPTSFADNRDDFRCGDNDPADQCERDLAQAERNFRTGCEEKGKQRLDPQVEANIAEVCKCGFDGISEALTFDEFKELDDDLRSDINADMAQEVDDIMRDCILEEAGLS